MRPIAAGPVQDQHLVAGRTIQIVVDGRILATNTEDNCVVIQGVHQGGGRSYVLIEKQSGGNACPSQFQAINLSSSTAVISPQFGNCSDLPSISVAGGALRVAVPDFRAARAATYTKAH